MKILVVEDERDLRLSLIEGLKIHGYAVDACDNGEDADSLLFSENYDLVILDLNLPGIDGMDVLENLRKANQKTKVLILSARSSLNEKILGLDNGANDYLTKPFEFAELLARIRSLLRTKTIIENRVISDDCFSFDTISRIAYANSAPIKLTNKEISILEYLILNRGRIIKLEELMEHVWDGSLDTFSNSIRVHISSLRRKIRKELGYDLIENRIGEGYIISNMKNE